MKENEQAYDKNFINKCKLEFGNFDKYKENLHKYTTSIHSSNSKKHKGYIVDLKSLEEFKDKIKSNDTKNIIRIVQVPFKTSTYLLNMLDNDHKYIIINKDLWKTVCQKGKENETPIIYEITFMNLILYLDDIKLKFSNLNNNIIEKNNYFSIDNLNKSSDFNEIKKIFKSIKEYNNFENNFSNCLKNSTKHIYSGYFVDKDWLDEWKKYTNYENIKNYYLEKKINEKIIIDKIIFDKEKNNKDKRLSSINIIKFKEKDEFESHIKMKSLALLGVNFINIFKSYNTLSHLDRTSYYLYNNTIEFTFNNISPILIKSNCNIILSDELKGFNNLKQLIRIFYFQKDLEKNINLPHRQLEINKIELNYYYLINKKLIKQYKDYYKSNQLNEFLKNYDSFKNINYNNFEEEFPKLLSSLKEKNPKYLLFLKKQARENLFQVVSDEEDFDVIKDNEKNILYVKDFEIINRDIFSFFIENRIINVIQGMPCICIFGDGRILTSFTFKDQNFYEIGFFEKTNKNLIIEYLIKEKEKSYKNHILNYFNKNGIKNFIQNILSTKDNNEIKYGQETIAYYFKLENNQFVNEDKRQKDYISINNEENDPTLNIISFLLSLFSFENIIKNKVLNSEMKNNNPNPNSFSKPFTRVECYLINKDILSTIKNISSYGDIKFYIESCNINLSSFDEKSLSSTKNDSYYQMISSKKTEFEKYVKSIFKYDTPSYTEEINTFYYPSNFNIITVRLFNKLLRVLNFVETEI